MIGVVLAGALPAQAGSIDLVISTLNGQPLQPAKKSITLNPSDTIGINVVYIADANNFLSDIVADMFFAGTGSGQFDISQMVFTDSYWYPPLTSVLTNDSNSLVTIIAETTFSIVGIQGNNQPKTVLENILFSYTGTGNIHIALQNDPNMGETYEFDQVAQDYFLIEDLGSGVDINGEAAGQRIPVELQIIGPNQIYENSQQQYNSKVYYDDGSILTVTNLCNWQVEPNDIAVLGTPGKVLAQSLIYPQEQITLSAQFVDSNVTVKAQKDITVNTISTIPELIDRNINDAKSLKSQANSLIVKACQRETANFIILGDMFKKLDWSIWSAPGNYNGRRFIAYAILHEYVCSKLLDFSVTKLQQAADILAADANSVKNKKK
jgi:ribosomal protein S19